ncbi:lytic transglycosylase domain-containing protein [Sphingomonas sp.]|uniref:lytic transglycosylase domain-containing protein n=1 Tax=Sphingomonas sp. TaxID=28214 RepID=UPI0025DFD3A4|nr:lytic transglycosylase domain-containing protein [Sphingomonas sp.]
MMSSMSRLAFLVPLLLATGASGAMQAGLVPAVSTPSVSPSSVDSDIDYGLSDWRRLRGSDGYAFADYARFIMANPGWPGETAMRRSAEKAMRPGETPTTVLGFFQSVQPLTGNGFARLAESLATSGRATEALTAARSAVGSADLGAYDEASLMARFAGQLGYADFDRRTDALLIARKTSDATRMLAWSSAARRPAFAARIALQTRALDSETQYGAVAAQVASDAGLLMDRARYLRDTGNEASARFLMARPHSFTARPANLDAYLDFATNLARSAAADRQYQTAYDIARQVDDLFPAGADVALQPLGVRDAYTNLTWLGGEVALVYLNRPADAVALFDRYSRGGRSLQVLTKGAYWAGRAATTAGRITDGNAYYERAAAVPESFYGQLALERLGRSVPAPGGLPAMLASDTQRSQFQQKRIVRALRQLGASGRRDEQTLFVRSLSEAVNSDTDRVLTVELSQSLGRPDLAVWTARSARIQGATFYYKPAFPAYSVGVSGKSWSLTHGITRQESSFDRDAMSPVGARGMMQLMPRTAREQAAKMGMAYDPYRLTSDPSFNMLLGSAYFARLVDYWGGNYPLAVASYNAGSGNVRKWIAANGDPRNPGVDVIRWIEDIPFTETRGYVQRVLENSVVYDRLNPTPMAAGPVHLSQYLGKSRPG